MDPNLAQKTVKYVVASSVLLKRALDENEAHRVKEAEARKLVPVVLERLTKVGGLDAGRRQEAERLLSKHAGTAELLGYALDQIEDLRAGAARQKVAEMGRGEPEKSASAAAAPGRNPNYLGQRSSDTDEATRAMARVLGVPLA